jgi:hypothetical protein
MPFDLIRPIIELGLGPGLYTYVNPYFNWIH